MWGRFKRTRFRAKITKPWSVWCFDLTWCYYTVRIPCRPMPWRKNWAFPNMTKTQIFFFFPVLFLPSQFSRNINTSPCTFNSPDNSAVFCQTEYSNKLLLCILGEAIKSFWNFSQKNVEFYACKKKLHLLPSWTLIVREDPSLVMFTDDTLVTCFYLFYLLRRAS